MIITIKYCILYNRIRIPEINIATTIGFILIECTVQYRRIGILAVDPTAPWNSSTYSSIINKKASFNSGIGRYTIYSSAISVIRDIIFDY